MPLKYTSRAMFHYWSLRSWTCEHQIKLVSLCVRVLLQPIKLDQNWRDLIKVDALLMWRASDARHQQASRWIEATIQPKLLQACYRWRRMYSIVQNVRILKFIWPFTIFQKPNNCFKFDEVGNEAFLYRICHHCLDSSINNFTVYCIPLQHNKPYITFNMHIWCRENIVRGQNRTPGIVCLCRIVN